MKKSIGFVSLALALGLALPTAPFMVAHADGRPFTEGEDLMLDDLTHETLKDESLFDMVDATGSYSYTNASYLSCKINGDNNSVNQAIYKFAPKKNEIGRDNGLLIKWRSPDNSIKLKDLQLHYRGKADKDDDTIFVELDKAQDEYGEPLKEISSDWQTAFIHAVNSTNNPDYISTYVALHLVADNDVHGTLDIKYLYYGTSQDSLWTDSDVYQIDDFEGREKPQQNSEHLKNCYWHFAKTGKIVPSGLTLVNGSYAVASDTKGNASGTHKNLIITAKGGKIDSIQPIYGTKQTGYTVSEPVLWESLRDNNDSKLPGISSDEFNAYMVNFENSHIDPKLAGVKINGSNTTIHNLFWSSVEPLIPATEFPRLNPNSRRVFEDYNRDVVGAESEYTPNTPTATQNDLYYIMSYHNPQLLSIENNALVFNGDGSNDTVINYKSSGCRVNNGAYPYIVFKMKGTDGATLNNFRFTTIDDSGNTTDPIYLHDCVSDVKFGLPALGDENYPYTTNDGWQYIIIDVKLSGLPKVMHGFDMYYSGAGKLYLDEVFYADRIDTPTSYTDIVRALELKSDDKMPEVNYELKETITAGETVAINPTVSDDHCEPENIQTVIRVKHNGKYIELTDNTFVAEKGNYIIIILAIDEAKNVNTTKLYRTVA